ncbi:hypothetical protein V8F33_012799 [Rhypophila sp. PSN 637]
MSALELAIELEPLPRDTFRILQDKFHAIILRELEDKEFGRAWLHRPALEVLTEYESGSTWFPLGFDAGRDSGYMFRLDSRHLLVWSINVSAPETSTKYRITEEDIFQVHEALIFPFAMWVLVSAIPLLDQPASLCELLRDVHKILLSFTLPSLESANVSGAETLSLLIYHFCVTFKYTV